MKNRSIFNPDVHHRRSIRFPEYDYAQPGFYFITICVQSRLCLFGEVLEGVMILNEAGVMIQKWYDELEHKYPDKKCHAMIVMPNHFHCIIENAPDNYVWEPAPNEGAHVGAPCPEMQQPFRRITIWATQSTIQCHHRPSHGLVQNHDYQ